jgi:hypothetical protein
VRGEALQSIKENPSVLADISPFRATRQCETSADRENFLSAVLCDFQFVQAAPQIAEGDFKGRLRRPFAEFHSAAEPQPTFSSNFKLIYFHFYDIINKLTPKLYNRK